jgi:ribosome-associated protein
LTAGKRAATERATRRVPPSSEVATRAARAAADKQGTDIVVLDVHELIVITDFFVICTASSQRQVKTVIEAIEDSIRELGEKPVRREGEQEAGWWLLDYVDVVVHVFGEEERTYYDLERLWKDAPRLEWKEPESSGLRVDSDTQGP